MSASRLAPAPVGGPGPYLKLETAAPAALPPAAVPPWPGTLRMAVTQQGGSRRVRMVPTKPPCSSVVQRTYASRQTGEGADPSSSVPAAPHAARAQRLCRERAQGRVPNNPPTWSEVSVSRPRWWPSQARGPWCGSGWARCRCARGGCRHPTRKRAALPRRWGSCYSRAAFPLATSRRMAGAH